MSKLYFQADTFALRELKNSDKENLLFLLNDSELKKHIPGLSLGYQGGMQQLMILANFNKSLLLVIEDISTRIVIGLIYTYIDIDGYSSSIHYVMNSNHRGKGIMPKALKLLIEYLYEQKLASNITFRISINNKNSITIMKKLHIPLFKESNNECIFKLSLTEELPF